MATTTTTAPAATAASAPTATTAPTTVTATPGTTTAPPAASGIAAAGAGGKPGQPGQPKIVLHHLNTSRSGRIFWLLEELGLQYDVVVHYRTSLGLAPESLKKVNPLGKAPALEVDGKIYTESGAIVHLLLTRFHATGLEQTASQDSVHWSHFSEGSLMLFLQPAFTIKKASAYATKGVAGMLIAPVINKFAGWYIGMANDNINNMLTEIESFLAAHPNFSGTEELGEGDFMMIFPLSSIAGGRDAALKLGPKSQAWVDSITKRPAHEVAEARLKREEEGQKKPSE